MNETAAKVREQDMLTTLFDLGRQVTGVLDLDELLAQIPRLIGRLIAFDAFAVYLLDERRGELNVAYSVGYPEGEQPMRLRLGEGLVGAAIASETPLLVNDVTTDPRYVTVVPGMASELVVPLRHQERPIGALNVLSHRKDQFTAADADAAAAVRRAYRGRASSTPGCSSRAAPMPTRSRRSPRSAATSRPCSTSTSSSRASRSRCGASSTTARSASCC